MNKISWINVAREIYFDMDNPVHIRNLLYAELNSNISKRILSNLTWENVFIDQSLLIFGKYNYDFTSPVHKLELSREWQETNRISIGKRATELLNKWYQYYLNHFGLKSENPVFLSLPYREYIRDMSDRERKNIIDECLVVVKQRKAVQVEQERELRRQACPKIVETEQQIAELKQTLNNLEWELERLYNPSIYPEVLIIEGNQRLNRPLEELNLSVRVFNSLKRTGITTIGDVLDMLDRGPDRVLMIHNFGEKSLDELVERLQEKGYLYDS